MIDGQLAPRPACCALPRWPAATLDSLNDAGKENVMADIRGWITVLYVIVGSSAGALTGLQFVVMTLIGEAEVATARTRSRRSAAP